MTEPIRYRETSTEPASVGAELRDAVALRVDPTRRCMLRFEIRSVAGRRRGGPALRAAGR